LVIFTSWGIEYYIIIEILLTIRVFNGFKFIALAFSFFIAAFEMICLWLTDWKVFCARFFGVFLLNHTIRDRCRLHLKAVSVFEGWICQNLSFKIPFCKVNSDQFIIQKPLIFYFEAWFFLCLIASHPFFVFFCAISSPPCSCGASWPWFVFFFLQ